LSTGGFGGGTGGLGGAGGFGGAQPGQQGYNPQGTTGLGAAGGLGGAAAGRSSFANRLQQIVNRAATSGDIVVLGNTKIIADERTNSLLIFASKTDINTIKDIVEKLDVVLAQVIIEALVLEVGLNDNYQFGISYLQRRKDLGGGSEGAGGIINSPPGIPIGDITQITGSNACRAVSATSQNGATSMSRFARRPVTDALASCPGPVCRRPMPLKQICSSVKRVPTQRAVSSAVSMEVILRSSSFKSVSRFPSCRSSILMGLWSWTSAKKSRTSAHPSRFRA
jgi:hypothetical protein